MKSRSEIKAEARKSLSGKRGTAIGALTLYVLMFFVGYLLGLFPVLGFLLVTASVWFVDMPLMTGVSGVFVKIYKEENVSSTDIFSGFSSNYMRKVGGMAWMQLWIFLWTLPVAIIVPISFGLVVGRTLMSPSASLAPVVVLLCAMLIVPIIKSISYSLTPYILADCPNATATDALRLSKTMMKGHKMNLFVFYLSWLGWYIGSVTILLLIVWFVGMIAAVVVILAFIVAWVVHIIPYMATATAGYYVEIKKYSLEHCIVTERELG